MKQRLIATFAVSMAVASTVAAVGLVMSLGQAPAEQRPADQLAQQTYVDTTTPLSTTAQHVPSSSSTVSKAPASAVKPGTQQGAVLLATTDPTSTTTVAPLPVACGYPKPGTMANPTDPSAPLRTAAPTPTVTAVFPPDTCPPYVAYP